jgi:tetratricopeptide (TPR) repeat protein
MSAAAMPQATFNFYPTDAEFATMPPYCQARYVLSSSGERSRFVAQVSLDDIAYWKGQFGPECWGMLHHYCAGVVHMQRSKTQTAPSGRKWELHLAEDEFNYATKHCPATDRFSANVATQMAMVYADQGRAVDAMSALDRAIRTHPDYDGAYIARSILLTRSGKASESKQVLLQGVEATGGTAELHYALGLAYFNLRDFEASREQARKAYALGYPIPGLRNKLEKAGYPL